MCTIISFFQKLIKGGGVGIRAGGWKVFQKLISGGDDYLVLKSIWAVPVGKPAERTRLGASLELLRRMHVKITKGAVESILEKFQLVSHQR